MRIRVDLAYDGTAYHGWAAQPGLPTVQATVEAALATALRMDAVTTVCAGRTDAGVHAVGQVLHADVDDAGLAGSAGRSADPPLVALVRRLNGILPPDVRVRAVRPAPDGFDARFSALSRRYVYRIVDRPADLDPLQRHRVLAWPRPIDEQAMAESARLLLGEHDFAAFCRRREGATTIRTLLALDWRRDGGRLEAEVRADAFCHSMVRALVGCLLAVGDGRRPWDWPRDVLRGGVRHPAVTVAPARGLTLEEVVYPDDAGVAARAAESRRVRA